MGLVLITGCSGSWNTTNVFTKHASLENSYKDEGRVRKAQICEQPTGGRCVIVAESYGVSGGFLRQWQKLGYGARGLTQAHQETLNFWKQLPHVMKYFRIDEDPKARLPQNFISGFLEVRFDMDLLQRQRYWPFHREGTRCQNLDFELLYIWYHWPNTSMTPSQCQIFEPTLPFSYTTMTVPRWSRPWLS